MTFQQEAEQIVEKLAERDISINIPGTVSALHKAYLKGVKEEYQNWLDKIANNEKKMAEAAKRGALTSSSFGLASGAMEVAGFKRHMKDRIAAIEKELLL